MKKFVFAAVISMLTSSFCTIAVSPLFAHMDGKACDMSADQKLSKLTKKLSLTKEQQAQVKSVLDEGMVGKTTMTMEECKVLDAKILPILDEKQKSKYQQMCALGNGKKADSCCPPASK